MLLRRDTLDIKTQTKGWDMKGWEKNSMLMEVKEKKAGVTILISEK